MGKRRADQQPHKTTKKMITETKQFKTLMLRDLDKSPQLVEVLNEVMTTRNIKTGQSAVEYVIAQHKSLSDEIAHLRKYIARERERCNLRHDAVSEELDKYKTIVKKQKELFNLIQNVEI